MNPSPEAGLARDPTRSALAVAGLFGVCGLATGVFGGSLPGLKAHLSLQATDIVGVLVAAAVFSVAAMNLSGPLADRVGARLPSLVGGIVMAAGVLVMGAAPDRLVLLAGAAVFGVGNGTIDVAMNALGVAHERAGGRPVMSRLHACFSIGNLAAALLVVLAGRLAPAGQAPRWSLWGAAVLVALLVGVLSARTPQSPPRPGLRESSGRGPVPPVIWLLAAMAVCFGLTEGTAVDWSSLHVAEVGHLSPSAGAWGLACVSVFMVLIRVVGDGVVERLGRATVVRAGATCALFGYLLTALADGLPVILAGWCLVGLGVGPLAPQIYGLAGHVGGGAGLARVVSCGYAVFLVGPALIGFTASHSDLQRAMLVPVFTAVGLIVLSARLPHDLERSTA